jgi:cell division septum initiation protein DivIVA
MNGRSNSVFASRDRRTEILGNRFNVVKNGLDEGEVSAFLEGVMNRNRELTLELERLRTALGDGHHENGAGASDPGCLEAAQRDAERIVAEARREAGAIIAEARKRVETAERQADEMLHEAALEVESARGVAAEEASKLIAEMKQKAEHLVRLRVSTAEDEGRCIIERAVQTAQEEAQRIREEAEEMLPASRQLREEPVREVSSARSHEPTTSHLGAAAQTHVPTGGEPTAAGEESTLYEGSVDLAIRPPIVLDRVVKLHRHLKKTPQVKVMDVTRSEDRGLRMRLQVPKRTPLLDVLKTFPEVKQVAVPRQEAELDAAGPHPGDKGRVRRVFITTSQ